jgi:hypothetical protein
VCNSHPEYLRWIYLDIQIPDEDGIHTCKIPYIFLQAILADLLCCLKTYFDQSDESIPIKWNYKKKKIVIMDNKCSKINKVRKRSTQLGKNSFIKILLTGNFFLIESSIPLTVDTQTVNTDRQMNYC